MRLMLVGRQEEEFLNAVIFPFGQELVQSSVEGLPLNPRGSRITFLSRIPYSIDEAGRQENSRLSGNLPRHPLCDEGVGSQRKMRTMLDQGPDREDQAGVPREDSPDFRPGEVFEGP